FIDADPDDRYSRLALATLLLAQPGQEARVAEVLGPLPQDDPDVLALRIEQALSLGRVDQASAMIDRAPPDDARFARFRGRVALRRGARGAGRPPLPPGPQRRALRSRLEFGAGQDPAPPRRSAGRGSLPGPCPTARRGVQPHHEHPQIEAE